ncbi:MAG: transporter periplasmic component-like protein, partial [Ramlibacter sp.]|nr:transporter periplasmic component-like protein [Ramlibacter sp.]
PDNQKRLTSALDNVGPAAASLSQLSSSLTFILDAQFGPERVNIPSFVKNADAAVTSLRKTSDQAQDAVAEFGTTARRLNEKDGPMDRLADGTQALSHAADSFNSSTLPRINRVTEDASRAVRQLGRTANAITDNPQSLIFGTGPVSPGPGETGFTAPGAGK